MNLISLINPHLADDYCSITAANYGLNRIIRFVSRFTTHSCKKIYKYILFNTPYISPNIWCDVFFVNFVHLNLTWRCGSQDRWGRVPTNTGGEISDHLKNVKWKWLQRAPWHRHIRVERRGEKLNRTDSKATESLKHSLFTDGQIHFPYSRSQKESVERL